jgi:hypothetical protein
VGYADPVKQAACARQYYLDNLDVMRQRAVVNNREKRRRN